MRRRALAMLQGEGKVPEKFSGEVEGMIGGSCPRAGEIHLYHALSLISPVLSE